MILLSLLERRIPKAIFSDKWHYKRVLLWNPLRPELQSVVFLIATQQASSNASTVTTTTFFAGLVP